MIRYQHFLCKVPQFFVMYRLVPFIILIIHLFMLALKLVHGILYTFFQHDALKACIRCLFPYRMYHGFGPQPFPNKMRYESFSRFYSVKIDLYSFHAVGSGPPIHKDSASWVSEFCFVVFQPRISQLNIL